MNAYCVGNLSPCRRRGSLCWVSCLSLLTVLASGCLTGPPSKLQIQAGRPLAILTNEVAAPASLTVTTFNVWGLPSWVNGASSSRYCRIAGEVPQLGSDVVLFQEVWTHRSFSDLAAPVTGAGWWAAYARRKGSFLGQNGLLTLSRYPILGAEVRHFSNARLPDSLMHKGALKITIAIATGQRFNIWNVHLQDGTSGKIRARQIIELIRWVQEAHDGQIADIVGGDFNFTPESPEFERFVAAIGPSVDELAGQAAFPTWDGLKPKPGGGEALDHIFVSVKKPVDDLRVKPWRIFAASRPEDRLSDHMGMEASLVFGSAVAETSPILAGRAASSALLETSILTRQ